MSNHKFEFKLPAKAEYLSVIRLTTSAIACKADFSIEKIEDLKLCVSEVCNIGINSGRNENFNLTFFLSENHIEIDFLDFIIDEEKIENIEMSKMILQALIEDIEFTDSSIKLKLFK